MMEIITVSEKARIQIQKLLEEQKLDKETHFLRVGVKGVLYCTGSVISHMKEKKSGHIVNLSSVAGRVVFPSSFHFLQIAEEIHQ